MRFKIAQVALLTMLVAQGCSYRAPEQPINDFWTWFSKKYSAESSAFQMSKESSQIATADIASRLKKVNNDLVCQLREDSNTKRQLIISAGGKKKLFSVVSEIVKDAPTMKSWKVTAFKPRVERLTPVEIDGMMVSPEDIFFTAQPHDGVVDISVLLDHTIPPATAEKIADVMLEQALGEHDAATKIGKVTFAPITELNEDNSNFRELQKSVDDYCK